MNGGPVTDDIVARYLQEHPGFFETHPELLSSITVPHRHGGRAISLHERQLDVLREKSKSLERRLSELIRHGEENDAIAERLQRWTRGMLLAESPEALPAVIVDGMASGFGVPQVALRLWRLREPYRSLDCAGPVEADVIALADAMKQPYCGPNVDLQPAMWLPEGGRTTRSIALMALRKGFGPQAFGLLVLGSADPGRFEAGMGTAFLERIAELASAALSRLVD